LADKARPVSDTPRRRQAFDYVAIILAAGISVALNVITTAMMVMVTLRLAVGNATGLGENATQILTGWGGGIIGVLGAYVGYAFGKDRPPSPEPPHQAETPEGDTV
jgi:hypothetical protein